MLTSEPELSVAQRFGMEPPTAPFRLLHIVRSTEHDQFDKMAFDVFVEVSGLVELGAPCLYFLAPRDDRRCGFALPEHAPKTHFNNLLMLIVDQDRAYEGLNSFEERVRARARRMVAPAPRLKPLDYDYDEAEDTVADPEDVFFGASTAEPPDMPEPPAWAEMPLGDDPGLMVSAEELDD